MTDLFDADFRDGVSRDMNNLLLLPKRYMLKELNSIATEKEYPYLYKFIHHDMKASNSVFTPSTPSTPSIDPTNLKVKKTGESFNPYGKMKIVLQNAMGKQDFKTLLDIYSVNDEKIPAGTKGGIKTLLDLFTYMENRCHIKEDKLDILYNHLMMLPSGPELTKTLLDMCEYK